MVLYYNMKRKFTIEGAIAIYKEQELFFSLVHYNLLLDIMKLGSINSAAKKENISYQQAWTLIDTLNRMSPIPIVVRQKGGAGGGGCVVSEYGKTLIKFFESKLIMFEKDIKELNFDVDKCFI